MEPTARPSGEAERHHCERIDPAEWNDKLLVWQDRPFLHVRVKTVFYVPIGMGKKLARAEAQLEGAGARVPHGLMLMQHRSPWEVDLFLDVARPVPGAEIVNLGGTFYTHVFEGEYRDAPRFAAEMQHFVESRGHKLRKLYYSWCACPSCAKRLGRRNQCVLFAEV